MLYLHIDQKSVQKSNAIWYKINFARPKYLKHVHNNQASSLSGKNIDKFWVLAEIFEDFVLYEAIRMIDRIRRVQTQILSSTYN